MILRPIFPSLGLCRSGRLHHFIRPLPAAKHLGPCHDGRSLGPDLNARLPNVNSSVRSTPVFGIVEPLKMELR